MSNDIFKEVNFNAGQEVRANDLKDAQKFLSSRLSDQIFDYLTPGKLVQIGDPDLRDELDADSSTKFAYALTIGAARCNYAGTFTDKVIGMTAGTLFQKISSKTGSDATLLAYTFAGTEQWTLADGDATNPRVDLLQMKLEYETTDSQARAIASEAAYATLDCGAQSTNWDTVLRAKVKGRSGHNIQVRTVSGASLSYTESGNLVTVQYETGVSTVADIETLIGTDSTLLEIQTAGTGANILVSPGDTFSYVALSGGADSVIASSNVSMKRQVKATVTVKQGTPSAAPVAIPSPDAGYVPIAAIVVHANYASGDSFAYEDQPTATECAVIMDMRMPICVKRYTVHARDCFYDDADWKLANGKRYLETVNEADALYTDVELWTNFGGHAFNWPNTFSDINPNDFGLTVDNIGGAEVRLAFPTIPGYVAKSFYVLIDGNTTVDATINIYKMVNDSPTSLYSATISNIGPNGGASGVLTASLADRTFAFGESLHINLGVNEGSGSIGINGAGIGWVKAPDADILSDNLIVAAPSVPGRVIGLAVNSAQFDGDTTDAFLCRWDGFNASQDLQQVAGFADDILEDGSTMRCRWASLAYLEDSTRCQAQAVNHGSSYGLPYWTNGLRAWHNRFEDSSDPVSIPVEAHLALRIGKFNDGVGVAGRFASATWYIAEGL